MRALVTGGAGFIGSHLVEQLLNQGYKVITLDDLSTGKLRYLNNIIDHPHHIFVQGSALDRALLRDLIEECDVIFHMAAVLGVKNTVDNPLKVIEGNIDSTRNVLELAFPRKKKVIFASTSEIYGKNEELPFAEDNSSRVLGPTHIHRWCYATAKALDEHLCFAYGEKGLPVTVVRYFNTYGPRQNGTQYGQVIPKFIKAALKNEPITIYGDGEQSRCFTFIDDTVIGTIACIDAKTNQQVFNIGIDQVTTINELALKIKVLSNSSSEITYIPYSQAYGQGYEDMQKRVPNILKAKQMLNYNPSVKLADGLMRTIEWYRDDLSFEGDRN
ncbi:NAD-dependent epimerase/dehydratase family protein [Bacillus sp. DNRA2]|nr:NAD-dependent epimerase/dehydratase family protein [Bacillus sp. DNRA2]NMD72087.1 NAD-dependent epimerase/dehydratase family protein [Bacillus sp. DNRA2]